MTEITPMEFIAQRIYIIREHKVMLDDDLARIYGVSTKRLNQQVRRNQSRFPKDFMFVLSQKEIQVLRLQNATSKRGRGGRRTAPLAFTEHGAVMVSSILNTPLAIQASLQIARTFVKLRRFLSDSKELGHKLQELEMRVGSHDKHIRTIFEAIRQLIAAPQKHTPKIGYRP